MKVETGSVGFYKGNSVIRFPRSKKSYRHLVCDCGNFQSISLNVVPGEVHIHPGHKLRRQAVCNNCGRRQIIGYGSSRLSD